jgi:hypothetical protein
VSPKTVPGKVLLGWMPRTEAIKVLTKLCVFEEPLAEGQASGVWEEYRDKVAKLPVRTCCQPASHAMSFAEKFEIKRFLKMVRRRNGQNVVRVTKIEPHCLVVHQLQIALHRAEMHATSLGSAKLRARTCLGFGLEEPVGRPRVVSGTTILELPHGEFFVTFQPGGRLQLTEAARFISIADLGDRTLLWAGYHRAYAVASQTVPEGTVRVLLATLIEGDADRFLGPDSDRPEVRDMVRGERPALFSDFFDSNLCMAANLRKQHPQLHVSSQSPTAKMVWVDEY